jgi:hypothetical protein
MLSCTDAAPLIAVRADGSLLDEAAGARLDEHLAGCDGCRRALSDQQSVAAMLRARPLDPVSPQFAARLAERLDGRPGVLDLADWRVWTVRLAPVAAVLLLAASLLAGGAPAPLSLEEWAVSNAGSSSAASLLWDSEVTTDVVLETMVTGAGEASGGPGDVR